MSDADQNQTPLASNDKEMAEKLMKELQAQGVDVSALKAEVSESSAPAADSDVEKNTEQADAKQDDTITEKSEDKSADDDKNPVLETPQPTTSDTLEKPSSPDNESIEANEPTSGNKETKTEDTKTQNEQSAPVDTPETAEIETKDQTDDIAKTSYLTLKINKGVLLLIIVGLIIAATWTYLFLQYK